MSEPNILIEKAILEYGGRRQLAEALGISVQAVQDWISRELVFMPKNSARKLVRINKALAWRCHEKSA